jgi:hypothetical protein
MYRDSGEAFKPTGMVVSGTNKRACAVSMDSAER